MDDADVDLQAFYAERCKCKKDCLSHFTRAIVEEQRLAILELDRKERDLIIIGQIRAHVSAIYSMDF